ncbi:inositol monophosphatase family protein [Microcella frigidaquae]|uniref:Inositol-1-monophosphatase n=1 Tax=Microcella frigidaquae TaxID=424758 RepID=A0A840XQV7_9MICO|nr:inositol monophosphatase family protein [Microcella frigidaquae]MBB5618319.1 myo-inositol-1(or 4)-monophosphatase [Microcella frigidaquae]NHN44776.1 inositol monophosphatase [Microcella frigidaquae]
MSPSPRATAELLSVARAIALEAGQLVVEARRGAVEVADRKSSPVDVVTQVDRDAESLIRGRLAELRPGDGFLGEESGGGGGTTGLTWVVDPIDGTVNFLYGIPHYAVSIAVVEGEADPHTWTALAGVVVNPATGELFSATAGGGAQLGERAIAVAPPVPLAEALIATGFAYRSETRAEQGAAVARLLPMVRDVRRMGTASLDLCAVASGRVNAYFERTLNPWDHAAGALIAAEAGARVTGIGGGRPDHRFLLAAHPDVAEALDGVLDAVGAVPGEADETAAASKDRP